MASRSPTATPPLALDLLCAGLVVCALAFIPHRGAALADDFMFPRELVLHATAVATALLCLARARTARIGTEDVLLAAFAALGALSALVMAGNAGLAARALGLTTSGLAVLWCARALAREGWGTALLVAAGAAAALLAATALLEAYGGVSLSMPNRAPGGVLGHRNSAAHVMVLATPVLALLAVRARRRRELALVCAALAMAAAVVVLSRSRGAWLGGMVTGAFALAAVAFLGGGVRTLATRRGAAILGALLLGGAAATVLPNRLGWRSGGDETLRRLADYQTGSGRGRVVQYARTLRMVGDHPLLGVGPGSWTLQYPRYAVARDPSYDPRALVPTNRLPQSDWTGLAAERGLPALLLLVLAGAVLAARSARALREDGEEGERGRALAALCVLAAGAVLGIFDPVLLQPFHAFFVLLVLGALVPPGRPRAEVVLRPALGPGLAVALLLASVAPLAVSMRQLWAATLLVRGSGPEALARAVRANPGDYRLQAMLAGHLVSVQRCDLALPHIHAAQSLFPTAPAPRAMGEHCRRASAPSPPPPATPLAQTDDEQASTQQPGS